MKSPKVRLITTEDGSKSLFNELLNETYHSTKGAIGESQHVFIEQGFIFLNSTSISILEVGFGTGLNVFLTLNTARETKKTVNYQTLEPFPISEEVVQQLNYAVDSNNQELFNQLHTCEWEIKHFLTEGFSLTKYCSTLEDYTTGHTFDLIYFDAFAPSKQPEVWSLSNLKKCYLLLNEGGVLVTYCAQGQFKRDLVAAGFTVEVLPGALGKKEMVRARK